MKNTKKIASILLALMMLLIMVVPAFAEDKKGSITIDNPIKGQTYKIYRIFDLESYNSETNAYSYKITENWKNFVKTGYGKNYFKVDDNGFVTLKDSINIDNNSEDAAALAKAALAYAKENKIMPDSTLPNGEGENKYTADNLPLGYYLVDSSLGALCGLTTTNPDVNVEEKNAEPTVDKEVENNGVFGDENTANINSVVNFKTTITVAKGAENYVLHDKMSVGLELNAESIKVEGIAPEGYTIKTAGFEDECDFEIIFKNEYISKLTERTEITVTYSAKLTEDAVIGSDGNTNETWLDYGDDSSTESTPAKTITYTYGFDLVKTKKDNTVLNGAKFRLYDTETGGEEIALVKVKDGVYRIADGNENGVEIDAGKARIIGLASGTYYLEETVQPDGYNKLAERVKVEIKDNNLDATIENNNWSGGGVQVVNYTGNELPSTGGIGTTIFYIVGGILLAGAAVLLIVKKRMNTENA